MVSLNSSKGMSVGYLKSLEIKGGHGSGITGHRTVRDTNWRSGNKLSEHKVFDANNLNGVKIKDFAGHLKDDQTVKEMANAYGISIARILSVPVVYNQTGPEAAYADIKDELHISWPKFDKIATRIEQEGVIVHELDHIANVKAEGPNRNPYKEDKLAYWDRPKEKKAFKTQLTFLMSHGLNRKEAAFSVNGETPEPKFAKMISKLLDEVYS